MISEHHRANEPDRKRFNEADIFRGLYVRYVCVEVRCWERFLNVAAMKQESCVRVMLSGSNDGFEGWERSQNDMVVSSGSMISPSCRDSTSRSGGFYQPSFSSHADFLRALVLQELSDNAWFENFSFPEDQPLRVDAIALGSKLCAKLRQFLFNKLCSRNHTANELLFITLRYRSLPSRHVLESEEDRRQRKY